MLSSLTIIIVYYICLVILLFWGRRKGYIAQSNNNVMEISEFLQVAIVGIITLLIIIFRIEAFWLLLLFIAVYGAWLIMSKTLNSFSETASLNFKKLIVISSSTYIALLFFTGIYIGQQVNFSF